MSKYKSLREASELLGIQVRTMREWIRKGKIKAFRLYEGSNRWYVSEEEIRRLTADDNKNRKYPRRTESGETVGMLDGSGQDS